jgi:hypothetical protein
MLKHLLLSSSIFMSSHAFSDECETSLDHIHSWNQMAIEVLAQFGHRITEVTDLAVKDFDFQIIRTGGLPPQECGFRFEWTGKVEFRGENTGRCLVRQPILKKLILHPNQGPLTEFKNVGNADYECER